MRTKRTKPSEGTVRIGGRDFESPVAAWMAVEADRRQCSPLQVGEVSVPTPLPAWVEIAGQRVGIPTAAVIAEVAARRNATPEWVIAHVLEAHALRNGGRRERADDDSNA